MRFFKKNSIVGKLALWYVVSVFVTALGGFLYLHWSLSHLIRARNHSIMEDRVQSLLLIIKNPPQIPDRAFVRRLEVEWPSWHMETVMAKVAYSNSGVVVAETPGLSSEFEKKVFYGVPLQEVDARSSGTPYVHASIVHADKDYLVLALKILPAVPGFPDLMYLALDLTRSQAILNHNRTQLMLTLFVLLIVTLLIGGKLSKAAFEPVNRIIQSATKISSATLHERVPLNDLPEEIRNLAVTVNDMLGRLEDAFIRLSRFCSDLAHELRTPLNNLRGEMEVTLSKDRTKQEYLEVLGSGLEEAERLSRIIEALLFLATAEQPDRQLKRESILLKSEIESLIEFHSPYALENNATLQMNIPANITVSAERTLFQRMVSNLLSNSIRHSQGGKITVDAQEVAGQIVIKIQDTGSGIPAVDLPRIFDRFYRADLSRKAGIGTGFGLGLTIVKTIVSLHGGRIKIQSKENEGTLVTVSLPVV
jgi:two-component system heavy metal sensor histidine kinase CusS